MEIFILSFGTIMFVLSQISERVSNFLKLYLPSKLVGNLSYREVDPAKEKKREKRILLLSWISGMITSLLFWQLLDKGDLDEKSPLFFLNSYKKEWWFYLGISIFLSFGAKFWHDFLDIIFLYKNSKRALQDPETYQGDSIEYINDRLEKNQYQIARNAWEKQKDSWQRKKGVVAVAIGFSATGSAEFRIYVQDKDVAKGIEKETIWIDEKGWAHHIPIQVIVSGEVHTQEGKWLSGGIYNFSNIEKQGTIGYVFSDNETKDIYILSCYHVMRHEHPWNFFRIRNNEQIRYGKQQEHVAHLIAGYRNSDMDIALAQITDIQTIPIDELPKIERSAHVDKSWIGKKVKIKGLTSGNVDAIIYEPNVEQVNVRYGDGSAYTFCSFFSLCLPESITTLKSVTKPGDSGALVYHEATKTALGFIVGGNDSLSYAMKISVVEKKIGISITPLSN